MLRQVLMAGVAATVLIKSGSAIAAGTDNATTAQSGPGIATLSEVVVTARRREERLQTVPQAITVHTGQQLLQSGVQTALDLENVTPSLSVTGTTGQRDNNIYTIRGQGLTFGGSQPGVQTYFAQVPVPGAGPALFMDLQNVQVLEGPQGTLFGRNNTGGAVLFEPRQPTNRFGGYLMGDVGDYGLKKLSGALNIPIVDDKLLVRIAAEGNERDGFTRNLFNGKLLDNVDYTALRLSITARPVKGFEDKLIVDHYDSRSNGDGDVLTAVGFPGDFFFPGLVAALAAQKAHGIRTADYNTDTYEHRQLLTLVNIATLQLNDNISLKNISGMVSSKVDAAFDFDGSPFPLIDITSSTSFGSTRQFSDEFQVQGRSFADRLTWIGGFYWQHVIPSQTSGLSRTTFGLPTVLYGGFTQNSKAVFGQTDISLAPLLNNVTFTAGYRYTWDDASSASSLFTPAGACVETDASGALIPCPLVQRGSWSAPAWNLTLKWQATKDVLAYVASRRGYKTGGFNGLTRIAPATFEPEYLTDVEVGLKTNWRLGGLDGHFNGDAYNGDYTNIQKSETTIIGATPESAVVNGAKATVRGVELDAGVRTQLGVELSMFYSYTDAHYDRFFIPAVPAAFPGQMENVSSMPFSAVPKHKVGANLRYTLPIDRSAGIISVSGIWSYQSRMTFSDINIDEPESFEKGYSLVNLRADWRGIGGHPIDAAVFVDNLANTDYRVGVNAFLSPHVGAGVASSLYGPPRMWGVEFRYHFGRES
ncbi:MAG: TonB-dependent receptor plug domain-containing protein [Caulobacteraceae bacterium]|nr:TonB-dependent receptor plug domain-containing protein [Caulobacteraceae bacterium]